MQLTRNARPLASWQAGQGDGRGKSTVASGQTHFTPKALAVYKRGRWSIVAKLTFLDGEPILAVAHRGQKGVDSTVSLPVRVVEYAKRHGARWFYFRRDTTGQMWRLPLADLSSTGWLGAGAEWYVRIASMQPVPWRTWHYAEQVVRLGDTAIEPQPTTAQLALWG